MANYWIQALKKFNKGKNTWCVAKKGTPENAEVRKIMERMKKEERKEESKKIVSLRCVFLSPKEESKKIDRTDQVKKGNKIPIVKEPHTMYKSANDVKPNRKVLNDELIKIYRIEKEQRIKEVDQRKEEWEKIQEEVGRMKMFNGTRFERRGFFSIDLIKTLNQKFKHFFPNWNEDGFIWISRKKEVTYFFTDDIKATREQKIVNDKGEIITFREVSFRSKIKFDKDDGEYIDLGHIKLYAFQLYDKSERGIQEHHQKMATKEKMAKEPHTMYKSSNDVKPNRKVLNAQHQIEKETYYYDDWWSFTLEQRNKHRQDTIKKYEKELNEIKNKIRKTTPSGKLSGVDRSRKWSINFIMGVGLTDFKDEDEESKHIPKFPRGYWATVDEKEYFYKDEKELLLKIAENFGAFNY